MLNHYTDPDYPDIHLTERCNLQVYSNFAPQHPTSIFWFWKRQRRMLTAPTNCFVYKLSKTHNVTYLCYNYSILYFNLFYVSVWIWVLASYFILRFTHFSFPQYFSHTLWNMFLWMKHATIMKACWFYIARSKFFIFQRVICCSFLWA